MIAVVLFDLDETLLDRTTSLKAFLLDQFERHAEHLGDVHSDEWCARFLALDQGGHVHKSIVYPSILSEFGGCAERARSLLDDYRCHCSRFAQPITGMVPVLESLRDKGLSIGIVTNGETEFQSRHIDALGLDRLSDAILISEREGLRKPDPALFTRAATRFGVEPTKCMFVGDNPVADILGAHAVGMKTAWFRRGAEWPSDTPSNPGPSLDHLSEVLMLLPTHAGATERLGESF